MHHDTMVFGQISSLQNSALGSPDEERNKVDIVEMIDEQKELRDKAKERI